MKHFFTTSVLALYVGTISAQPPKIKYKTDNDEAYRYAQHIVETKNGLTPAKTTTIKQRVTGQAGFFLMGGAAYQFDSLKFKYSGERGSRFRTGAFTFIPNFYWYPDGDGSKFGDLEVKADSAWKWEGTGLDLEETFINSFSTTQKILEHRFSRISDPNSSFKSVNKYDGNSRLTEMLVFDWNTNTSAWDSAGIFTYTYNPQNQIVADSKYHFYFGPPTLYETHAYQYNSNGYLLSKIRRRDSGNGLVDVLADNFTYNPDQTIKESVNYYNYGSGLLPRSRDSFGYGSTQPHYTYQKSWGFDTSAQNWEPRHLTNRSINAKGLVDTTEYSSWNSLTGEFELYLTVATTYNSQDNPVITDFYEPNGSTMDQIYFYRFTYESYQDLSVPKEHSKLAIVVYPNPAQESIQILFKQPVSGPLLITINNAMGQRVSSYGFAGTMEAERISLSGLTPGLYYLSITRNNGEMIHRQTILISTDNPQAAHSGQPAKFFYYLS
jgi:hypothetical protein